MYLASYVAAEEIVDRTAHLRSNLQTPVLSPVPNQTGRDALRPFSTTTLLFSTRHPGNDTTTSQCASRQARPRLWVLWYAPERGTGPDLRESKKTKKKGGRSPPRRTSLRRPFFPFFSTPFCFLSPSCEDQRPGCSGRAGLNGAHQAGVRCSVTSTQHAPSLSSRTRLVLELYQSYRRPGGSPRRGGWGARNTQISMRSECLTTTTE